MLWLICKIQLTLVPTIQRSKLSWSRQLGSLKQGPQDNRRFVCNKNFLASVCMPIPTLKSEALFPSLKLIEKEDRPPCYILRLRSDIKMTASPKQGHLVAFHLYMISLEFSWNWCKDDSTSNGSLWSLTKIKQSSCGHFDKWHIFKDLYVMYFTPETNFILCIF